MLFDEQTGVDAEKVSFPALPEDLELFEEFEGWTVGLVRECVGAIVSHAEAGPDKLLMAAVKDASRAVVRAKHDVEKVERDLMNTARDRLLPDKETLEKVARYEAHLSRGLYSVLHND